MENQPTELVNENLFLSLSGLSASLITGFLYLLWYVMEPGLARLATFLPLVVGGVFGLAALLVLSGVLGIGLALLGVKLPKAFYFWCWKDLMLLFPLAVFLGKLLGARKFQVEQSFIRTSNSLVRRQGVKVPADRIMMLTPHCIQRDTCVHKITRNVENCRQCGGCGVGTMLGLAHKYGCHFAVATGGTLARQMVKQAKPKAIVAVACERDLTSGIQDVFPLPVIGVLNERPFGPCFNTRVDVAVLEAALIEFMEEQDIHAGEEKVRAH